MIDIASILNWIVETIKRLFGADDSGSTPVHDPHQPTAPLTESFHVVVAEADGGEPGVDTGIDVRTNDFVSMHASGSIWAGVWLTGENGPDGWEKIEDSADFPLPNSRPFGLLYKLVEGDATPEYTPWHVLGTGDSFDWSGDTARLWLTINDDVPDNGSGAFGVDVDIRHAPRTESPLLTAPGHESGRVHKQ